MAALHAGEGDVNVAHAAADGPVLICKLPSLEALETRVPAAHLQGHTGAPVSFALSTDGIYFASASIDRSARGAPTYGVPAMSALEAEASIGVCVFVGGGHILTYLVHLTK